MGKVTGNKFANAQSGTVWVIPPPMFSPHSSAEKTIWIGYQNISDADVSLARLLRDAATSRGWTVVNNREDAHYRMTARTRFFGEVEPDTGGSRVADQMGVISGAITGIGTGYVVADATDNLFAGAVAGGAVGGLVGMGIKNTSTPREWAMITDFVLEERLEEPIEISYSTSDSTSGSSSAGTGNGRMNEGGSGSTGNNSSASGKKMSEYYPHGVRLSAWANQMGMSEGEAMDPIVARVEKVVQQMLPE